MDEDEARRLGIYVAPVILAYRHHVQHNAYNPLPNEGKRQTAEQKPHSSSSEEQDSPRSKLRT